jgi:hypothetical protein
MKKPSVKLAAKCGQSHSTTTAASFVGLEGGSHLHS